MNVKQEFVAEGAVEQTEDWPSAKLGWYAVAVLFLAYTFSYVDRVILTILVEPIQRDLNINDSQLALLHGLAFVIFYVGLGIPLGYIADRVSRKKLIVGSIVVWSLMTAACGTAKTFGQLFAARIGVGVGEAGLSPASYSLIGDYFAPNKRSAALGAYTVAMFFGGGLALMIGGLVVQAVGSNPTITLPMLGEIRSWQAVFFLVGLPGLLVALLALTIHEPKRRSDKAVLNAATVHGPSFGEQFSRHRSAYLLHFAGFAALSIPFNVTLLWARPFLSRVLGLTPAQGAYTVGTQMMIFCSAGVILGSLLADRMQRRGKLDGTIRVAFIASSCLILPLAIFPFMPSVVTASLVLSVILFFGAFAYGAGPAALQLITPNGNRAMMSALYLLGINIVGLTVGPTLTGVLTDYVFQDKAAVGYSAAIVGVAGALLAAALFGLLIPRFRQAVELERS
jgi:MFS family permease